MQVFVFFLEIEQVTKCILFIYMTLGLWFDDYNNFSAVFFLFILIKIHKSVAFHCYYSCMI